MSATDKVRRGFYTSVDDFQDDILLHELRKSYELYKGMSVRYRMISDVIAKDIKRMEELIQAKDQRGEGEPMQETPTPLIDHETATRSLQDVVERSCQIQPRPPMSFFELVNKD